MSKQRYVNDSFWTDPYVENLDPSEKLLFLYFLTNPLCNVAGIYEVRNSRVAYETGFDKEMVEKIKKRFIRDKKLLCVDDWMILSNFAKNQSHNPNVLKGMQRIIDDLPDKVKALKGFERLPYFTLLNLTLPNLTEKPTAKKKSIENVIIENDQSNIVLIIDEFKKFNPSAKNWYGNKTQRKACTDLIEAFGLDDVLKMVDSLPKINEIPYVTSATTPLQLFNKYTTIQAQLQKQKLAINSKKNYEVI